MPSSSALRCSLLLAALAPTTRPFILPPRNTAIVRHGMVFGSEPPPSPPRQNQEVVLPATSGEPETTVSRDPRRLVKDGMDLFRRGDVRGSVKSFDGAIAADERFAPLLWQRGLSLYYAEDYAAGAQQFRKDVALNPNDTEEAIWTFLCEARMPNLGFDAARERLLVVGKDPRPYMRTTYELFAGRASEEDLARVGHDGGLGSAPDFYAKLYLGLLNEAKGETAKAREYLRAAADSPYGPKSNDYMWALAKVHVQERKW